MDFVGPFVNVIDTYLIAPLARQINYLRNSNDNVNGLQTIVQNLKARRNDEQSKLKAQENSGQVKTDVASNWFNSVHGIEMEADVIEKEKDEGKCVNCWSRYKLSKRSVELKLKADQRLKEQFDVARPASPKPVIEKQTESIENQPSTQRMLQQILDCVGNPDPQFGIIGVYGMGGVGKTTLAKQVNNHFKENSCFDNVIMVTVSATPNIPSIQTSISKRLGLPDNSEADDALFEALRNKKFLLILDDVWNKLELKDVGIPHPRNHNGSKILVTSRSKDACTDMGAKKVVKVVTLSEAESWNLFVEVAGEHVVSDDIKRFAEKIVGRCKGLPLAVVTVGHAMANRHEVGSWEDALRELEQSASGLRGMEEEVFVPLKFSFDRLENDMLRSLFLYCACFPEDYNLNIGGDEMLNYCVGEGLVDKLGSLKAARNKGEFLIESLKIGCMLEDGEDEGSVKMHDMMRELAIWITSSSSSESGSSPKFLIKTGESFKEAPQSHEWVDATRISLIETQIEELPELGERCPKLTTFLFRQNKILTIFPQTNFLEHMDHLSVLDLSHTWKLESLPDYLSCLLNLRVLSFFGCDMLRALPALGMLRRLQVLDLGFCLRLDQKIILEGSECVGGVSNLRYLNVEKSKATIPVEVICRLHKLEELNLMGANNIKWRVSTSSASKDDENYSMISTNIDVGELSHLTYLTSLSISFEGIIISADWFKPPLANKFVKLELKSCTVLEQDNALQALNESQNLKLLFIDDCPGVTCVPTDVVDGEVQIENCKDFETVVFDDGAAVVYHNQFSFESLTLMQLPKLESLCVGVAPLNCFNRLSRMMIWRCDRLKKIFTNGMPREFNNLRIIQVLNCERMEVIIEAEEEEEEIGVISPFPRLESLCLQNLPALHDLCSNHILHCPLLNLVWVTNCPMLKKDPLHIRNADGLLVIEEETQQWEGNVLKEEIQEETRRE